MNIKSIIYSISPRLLTSIQYFYHFRRLLNWVSPKDLNEKIHWLKFNSDTSLWTLCADKYKVREYVHEKGLDDTLVTLYGVWERAEDIDWDSLPDSFVLKTNNGSGDILVCKDKNKLNIEKTVKKYAALLQETFSNTNGEPHYAAMKPCLIAEELLDNRLQQIETDSLIDYKIWCFNGIPHCVWACYNRHKDSVEVATYDLDWNRHDEYCISIPHYKLAKINLPKPVSLSKMLYIASKLSEGIPQVRVDLYEIGGKPYFGEMTFTSAGGFMNFYTPRFLREMGDLVDLSLVKRRHKTN